MARWELQCANNCGNMVVLSRKRYMELFDADRLPLCGTCRRYAGFLELDPAVDPRKIGGGYGNRKRKGRGQTRPA
jgi:hypothetical protein